MNVCQFDKLSIAGFKGGGPTLNFYPSAMRGIVIIMSVCLSVCNQRHVNRITQAFFIHSSPNLVGLMIHG